MNRNFTVLVSLCVGTAGVGYAASPYWAWHEIHAAADAGDRNGVMSLVDTASVREGFIVQANDILTAGPDGGVDSNGAVGAMEAMALPKLAEAAASQLLTPDHLMSLIKNGRVAPPSSGQQRVAYNSSYRSLNSFVVTMSVSAQQPATLYLERRGLFDWMVVRVGLPILSGSDSRVPATYERDSNAQRSSPKASNPKNSGLQIEPAPSANDLESNIRFRQLISNGVASICNGAIQIPAIKSKDYGEARQLLQDYGWRPLPQPHGDESHDSQETVFSEEDDCGGGVGGTYPYCHFEYKSSNGPQTLTINGSPDNDVGDYDKVGWTVQSYSFKCDRK